MRQDAVQLPKHPGHGRLPIRRARPVPQRHLIPIHPVEPATEPVVAPIVHHVQKGRRGHDQADGAVADPRGTVGRRCQERRVRVLQARAVTIFKPREQGTRLPEDERRDVPLRRGLVPALVDPALRTDRGRLVGGKRVHRKEPGRVAGEPIRGHHLDPPVHAICRACGPAP